jgi:hypothetical protein
MSTLILDGSRATEIKTKHRITLFNPSRKRTGRVKRDRASHYPAKTGVNHVLLSNGGFADVL